MNYGTSTNRKWNYRRMSVLLFISVICSLTIGEEGHDFFPQKLLNFCISFTVFLSLFSILFFFIMIYFILFYLIFLIFFYLIFIFSNYFIVFFLFLGIFLLNNTINLLLYFFIMNCCTRTNRKWNHRHTGCLKKIHTWYFYNSYDYNHVRGRGR